MGENHSRRLPVALYGVVLLMASIAYYILQQTIIRAEGPNSVLEARGGHGLEGEAVVAASMSWPSWPRTWVPWLAEVIYVSWR